MKIFQLYLIWSQTTMIFVKNLKPFFALASLTIMNSSTSPKLRKKRRFQRFSNFASVEIKGQIYMTPQDFLENIVFDLPKPRIKRQVYSNTYLQNFKIFFSLKQIASPKKKIRKCRKEMNDLLSCLGIPT